MYILNFSRIPFKDKVYTSNNIITKIVHRPCYSLSQARNYFLKDVKVANIIGFPDDDCEYPTGLLQNVIIKYKTRAPNCIGCCYKFVGEKNIFKDKIFSENIFGNCISFNFFLFDRKNIYFDKRLGLCNIFIFGEESEMLLRELKQSNYLLKEEIFCIKHPIKSQRNPLHFVSQGIGMIGFLKIIKIKNINLSIVNKAKLLFGSLIKVIYYGLRNDKQKNFK